MKNVRWLAIIFLASLPMITLAASPVWLPFGGEVVAAPITNVGCAASFQPTSPFAIIPTAGFVPGPFSELPGPTTVGMVLPGAWILGLYYTVPIPDCVAVIPPLGPTPVLKAFLFGTSIPLPAPI